MNEQLKIMNKKIKLLNDVIALNHLFTDKQDYTKTHYESSQLTALIKNNCKGMPIFQEKPLMYIAKEMRSFFFNAEVVIKRKVVNDRLISIYLQDPKTNHICPLNSQVFVKMLEKIKV